MASGEASGITAHQAVVKGGSEGRVGLATSPNAFGFCGMALNGAAANARVIVRRSGLARGVLADTTACPAGAKLKLAASGGRLQVVGGETAGTVINVVGIVEIGLTLDPASGAGTIATGPAAGAIVIFQICPFIFVAP